MNRRFQVMPLGVLVTALAGCVSMAPHYQRPEAPVAQTWPGASSQEGQAATQLQWQSLFADAKLRQVVQLALDNNRDLRVAVLNIEKARAQYRIQRAALLPQVSVDGNQTAQRTPDSLAQGGQGGVSRSYAADVGISAYELDLFGRVRSLKNEALQQYLATAETRRSTQISLVAEVANAYMSLAADMQLKALADQTLETRQQSFTMQQAKSTVGTGSDLEERQAEAELEAARVSALSASSTVQTDRNALELLMGTPLSEGLLPDPAALDAMLAVHEIPAGMPSDLLRDRPDILAAEHQLMAANADIGAARAAFFPTISLTASTGTASSQLSGLFDSGSRSWSFIPQLTLPIFDAGKLRAQLGVSKAERDIAVANYESAIQSAFKEVADALAQRAVIDDQLAAQQRRQVAAHAAYDLADRRYSAGVSSYLDVLDAQRTLLGAQQDLVETRLQRQSSVVTLYKALGGGWSPASAVDGNSMVAE